MTYCLIVVVWRILLSPVRIQVVVSTSIHDRLAPFTSEIEKGQRVLEDPLFFFFFDIISR